jgi:hypothetical protein
MSATVTGVFRILDRASGPMRNMERQALKTDAAIAATGDRLDDVGTAKHLKNMDATNERLETMDENNRKLGGSSGSVRKTSTDLDGMSKSSDKLNTSLTRTGLKLASLQKILTSFKFPIMIGGLGQLVQIVSALGGAITSMLPQVGQWLGSVVSLLPNLARLGYLTAAALPGIIGLGTAAIGAKLAFSGMGEAITEGGQALARLEPQARKVAQLLRTTGKDFKENLEARAQSSFFNVMTADRLKSSVLSKQTQKQAGNIVGTGATTAGMMASNVTSGLFGAGNGGFLADIEKVTKKMQPVLVQLSGAFVDLAQAARYVAVAAMPMTKWLGDTIKGWTEYWEQLAKSGKETGSMAKKFETATIVAEQFGRIIRSLWRALGDVFQASDRAGQSLWDSAEKGAKRWEQWTSSFAGKNAMQDWFDHARESASTLWSVTKNLGRVLLNVGGASRQAGDDLWKSLDRVTEKWADWTSSLEGQMSMADYFNQVKEPLKITGEIVADMAGAFVALGKSSTVTETLKTLKEGVAPLASSLDSLGSSFGPALANTLVQILRLFTNLQATGGAFGRVLEMFNSLLEVLNLILEKVPGLTTLFTVVIGGLAMQKVIGGIKGLAASWGLVATQATAAAAAQTRAAGAGGFGMLGGRRGGAGQSSPGVGGVLPVGATATRVGSRGPLVGHGGRVYNTAPVQGPVTASGAGPAASSPWLKGAGAAGAGAMLGGGLRAAGRFAGPVAALFAISDYLSTEGSQLDKFQGAVSGATLGIVPGPISDEQAATTGTQQGMATAAKIYGQTGANRGGVTQTTAALRQLNQQIRLLKGQEADNDSDSLLMSIGKQMPGAVGLGAIIGDMRDDQGGGKVEQSAEMKALQRARRQAQRARGEAGLIEAGKAQKDLEGAFDVRKKHQGAVAATRALVGDVLQEMGPKLASRGSKALAQANLTWLKEQAKNNPKLQGVYKELQQGVEDKFKGMEQNVRVVNGKIYTGTDREWKRIKESLVSKTEKARQEVQKGFTAMQQSAVQSLITMGYSGSEARNLVGGADASGGGPGAFSGASTSGSTGGGGGGGRNRGPGGGGNNARGGRLGRYAGGGRIGGVGTHDSVPMLMGMAAPGELVVNRHTEKDIDRDLAAIGSPPLGRRVQGERRAHSDPERTPRGIPKHELRHTLGGRLARFAAGGILGAGYLAQRMGLAVGEHPSFGGVAPVHTDGSYHYSGDAVDVSGDPSLMNRYFHAVESRWMGKGLAELFYDPVGYYIKHDAKVPGAIGNHMDHVHAAITSGAIGRAGRAGGGGGMMMGGGANRSINVDAPKTGMKGAPGGASQALMNALAKGLEGKVNRKIGGGGGGGGNVTGNGVPAQIARVLLANGVNRIGAAGIIGNAYAESSFDPAAQGYGGGGLWGFTASPNSLADLQAYASQRGGQWTNAALQTRFLLEHVAPSTISAINAAGTPEAAAEIFMTQFERPGIPRLDVRQEAARTAFSAGYFKKGGRVPDFGGWFGEGGHFDVNGPTMIGVGERGKERVKITPASKSGGAGDGIKIGSITINNNRPGDIKRQLKKELNEAFSEFAAEVASDGSGVVA